MSKRLWFAYLCALAVWGLLSYAHLGHLHLIGKLFAFYENGRPYVSDFADYYNAALVARHATTTGADIYDPVLQDELLKKVIEPVKPELPFFLQYPPFFFLLVTGLASLSMYHAWLLWNALGFILLSLSLVALLRGQFTSRFPIATAAVAFFGAYPTWLGFRLGQASLFLFPALVAFFMLLRAGKKFLAGLVTGFMAIKPQYAPVLWLTGLIAGRLPFLAGAVAMVSILLIATGAILGWHNVINYPKALLLGDTSEGFSGVPVHLMQNFRGALALAMGGETESTRLFAIVLMFAALLFVGWLWLRFYPRLAARRDHAFEICASLTTLALVISSLHTFPQDYLFVAIPCIWLWKWTGEDHRLSRVVRWTILLFPIFSWVFFLFQAIFLIGHVQPFFLWAAALLAFVLSDEIREQKQPDSRIAKSLDD